MSFQPDLMDPCTEIMLLKHAMSITHIVHNRHLSMQNGKAHLPPDLQQVTCYMVVDTTRAMRSRPSLLGNTSSNRPSYKI